MPSKAWQSFNRNVADIDRLLELHAQEGGISRGRRFGLEVLNKSAVVLIAAFWESYCEDVAAEGLAHIVAHAKDSSRLPNAIKKMVAAELKRDDHELAVWQVADGGWRQLLTSRLIQLREKRNRKLNTPKSDQIDELFREALGIEQISNLWKWHKMTADQARKKLDKYVELRGSIAHRGSSSESVKKVHVTGFLKHVREIASRTGGGVNAHVREFTGRPLWRPANTGLKPTRPKQA